MKVVIAGGRDFTNREIMFKCLDSLDLGNICVVSGHAKGADSLGEEYAKVNGLSLEIYPAEWNKYGKQAGAIRNIKMAHIADLVVVFWNGFSRGTKIMVSEARKLNKPVVIFDYNGNRQK